MVDYFYHKFTVSIQIMPRNYCTKKCKTFSTCNNFLMVLLAIFLIQIISTNYNLQEYDKPEKRIPSKVHFKDFVRGYKKSFLKCKFPCRYFPTILMIDSELTTLKMDFFEDVS